MEKLHFVKLKRLKTLKLLQAVTLLCLTNEILCLSCIELQQKSEKECFTSDMRKSHNGNYGHCVKTRMKRHQSFCDTDGEDDDYYCRSCSCDSCSYNKCEGKVLLFIYLFSIL
ncbi:hypothetical protein HUJ05_007367 [Dendroctonus ponderosae]|nr:hypothetical protein HUJ05_007367 [Dendroctonus ponderosae]